MISTRKEINQYVIYDKKKDMYVNIKLEEDYLIQHKWYSHYHCDFEFATLYPSEEKAKSLIAKLDLPRTQISSYVVYTVRVVTEKILLA